MRKIIKDSYIFLMLFIIYLLKEPIYKLYNIESNQYVPLKCSLLESDYNKLLEFSEIDYIYESDYINTSIIYKDIYNYLNEITIRGGSNDFLKKYPVVYDNTLIGLIDSINKESATVKLLTNNKTKLSVKINEEIGVLEYKKGSLVVSNISNYSNIHIGDAIYTSGFGNIRENIFIGYVKGIETNNKKIEKIIKVDYRINIKDINFVTVIKESI